MYPCIQHEPASDFGKGWATRARQLDLRKPFDFNILKNSADMTPLIPFDSLIIKLLIGKGADVNAINGDGRTPLAYAIDKGHDAVAEMLRQHGRK